MCVLPACNPFFFSIVGVPLAYLDEFPPAYAAVVVQCCAYAADDRPTASRVIKLLETARDSKRRLSVDDDDKSNASEVDGAVDDDVSSEAATGITSEEEHSIAPHRKMPSQSHTYSSIDMAGVSLVAEIKEDSASED